MEHNEENIYFDIYLAHDAKQFPRQAAPDTRES